MSKIKKSVALNMNREFYTVNEVAEQWELTPRWVRNLCASGKILGAIQFGCSWAIPKDAEKSLDGRITTGEYKNWRMKSKW